MMRKIVNMMKLWADAYDVKHGIRQIHYCGSKRRNENRREAFRIPEGQPQCPVYKDDRCCGGCPLLTTCDYTTNCNCSGFTIGGLGSKERYFMLEKDNAKYGRMTEGSFDYDFYYISKLRETIVPGKYVALGSAKEMRIPDQESRIAEIGSKYGCITGTISDNGNVEIQLLDGDLKPTDMTVEVYARGLQYYNVFSTLEEIRVRL